MTMSGKSFQSTRLEPSQEEEASTNPKHLLDARWLRALYHDLHGRAPLASERAAWAEKELDAFLDAAFESEAVWRHWLDEQLYYFMLIDRFEPVGTTLDKLPKLLSEGRTAPQEALHLIALSTSFELRNPGADTFVTVVMEQFCGIEVQRSVRELEIGKKAYDGGTGTFLGSPATKQSDVVNIAATHIEAARHLVEREHQRLCRSPLKKAEIARTGKRVHRKPMAMVGVYREWFHSDAYVERVAKGAPLSNRAWVESVYVDLGDAIAPEEEVEALRGALDSLGDPMPLRSLIVRMLLDEEGTRVPRLAAIEDPGAWLVSTFVRLLGRPPTDEESRSFLSVCTEGPGGPGLAVYALLTSEEYQRS